MSFEGVHAAEIQRQAEIEKTGDALYNLGLLYSTGQGVELNYVQAHKWFNLAAMQGNDAAREWRKELSKEMSPDEVAAAQREAREWLSSH